MEDQNGLPVSDSAIIDILREQIDYHEAQTDWLITQLKSHQALLKRDQRILELLLGESAPKPKPKRVRTKESRGTSPEFLEQVEKMVLEFARDHEEFRQVDIRSMPDNDFTSSHMATAFEKLRQAGVIRFVRKEGLSRYYRLCNPELFPDRSPVASGSPDEQ